MYHPLNRFHIQFQEVQTHTMEHFQWSRKAALTASFERALPKLAQPFQQQLLNWMDLQQWISEYQDLDFRRRKLCIGFPRALPIGAIVCQMSTKWRNTKRHKRLQYHWRNKKTSRNYTTDKSMQS